MFPLLWLLFHGGNAENLRGGKSPLLSYNIRPTFHNYMSAKGTQLHNITLVLKPKSIDTLEEWVHNHSDPTHASYQQWMTDEELIHWTYNTEAWNAVMTFAHHNRLSVTETSIRTHSVQLTAPISVWNEMFNATFQWWKDDEQNKLFLRTPQFILPLWLQGYVWTTMETTQPPVLPTFYGKYVHRNLDVGVTTLPVLNQVYQLGTQVAEGTIQSVFETSDQNFQLSDLVQFQTTYGLQPQLPRVTGTTPSTTCSLSTCAEGNLDIQYMMGVAQNAITSFDYVDYRLGDPFVQYLTNILNMPASQRPTTVSISYGADETYIAPEYARQFNTLAIQLAALGVTIFVSSGDSGVAGNECRCGLKYVASYPASSPWVVAVGATQGPEQGKQEVACQADLNQVITSGGGFSSLYTQPTYQTAAVQNYIQRVNPSPGFNPNGRAYPDVSLLGVNYQTIIGGQTYGLYGTSASAPVLAAMVSILNAERAKRGRPPVGNILPTLYQHPEVFTDIGEGGNNRACSSSKNIVCDSGFYTALGWDPVTGLGSITLPALRNILDPITTPPVSTMPPSTLPSFTQSPTPVVTMPPSAAKPSTLGLCPNGFTRCLGCQRCPDLSMCNTCNIDLPTPNPKPTSPPTPTSPPIPTRGICPDGITRCLGCQRCPDLTMCNACSSN